MFGKIVVMSLSLVVCACTSMVDDLENRVQQKLQQMLAEKFAERLTDGIDVVVSELAKSGGYLNDPLVRILLPPPLGIIAGVASELQKNPDADLLQTLMNQAAEHAIPVAGPILKNLITHMDEPTLEGVLHAGNQGASQYLKQHAGDMVQTALLPAITAELNANGAVELYGKLLDIKSKADSITATANDVQQTLETAQQLQAEPENIAKEQLAQYVAEQAMGGMFRKIAQQELSIRQNLQQPML
ncbi:DUF4197 domain-containing protein [Shewanella yunxiaonensis]|uniref:DUF4197 domain-containing protein n=1 Tax=Shewanella yunxiaonensis TaxID=2829809 RepID=A0ABX7YQZ1_9GAMM|nr:MULTISPECIES: DUF4197 domain-containing protein [Shewanella]MDF0534025.1 DUF4197 domain-containing protein [Shewanella sp. A32]QUN05184.1 DUF4197 domain-containing protein [Shewanella yunxiaonensis]